MAVVRVGIGGWTYAPWRGSFFPPGLAQAKELEFASRQLGAIEINGTFYSRQKRATWEKWGATVPDGFQFAVKASRYCVTRPKLAEAGEAIGNFLGQGLVALGDKLGPILWMLAARRQFDREDIAAFLALLPGEYEGVRLCHVIEPSNESFRDAEFLNLCREHDVAIAFVDHAEAPCIEADTASFAYARLKRMRSEVATGYDLGSLDGFAERARQWSSGGRDAYIFMINGAKERAPAAALALQQRLG